MASQFTNQEALVSHIRRDRRHLDLDRAGMTTVVSLIETFGNSENYRPIGNAAIDAAIATDETLGHLAGTMQAAEYVELVQPLIELEERHAA